MILEIDDQDTLLSHFEKLHAEQRLPSLDDVYLDSLIAKGKIIVDWYASPNAYERALSKEASINSRPALRVPTGKVWDPSSATKTRILEAAPQGHIEAEGFDGDRVLANSILFLLEYGWWMEAAYAIPEGDIGRFIEIMKV